MDMAVGNFVGHGVNLDQTSPTMQLALHFTCVDPWGNARSQETRVLGVGSDGTIARKRYFGYSYSKDPGIPFIAPVDYDGDSWRLGAPVRITFSQFPKLDAVVQEPPKHVDYLPLDPRHPEGTWDVFNVGAYSEFSVKTHETTGKELKTTTKSNSSYDIGGGGSVDVKACMTLKHTCDKNPPVSGGLKLGIQGKYESSESEIDHAYSEAQLTYEDSTSNDDNLTGKFQSADAWRYPIIGYETPPPESILGFYEVVIPSANQDAFRGAAMNHADFYQPLHENHNVLSYPALHLAGGGSWVPSDLGPFTIPDPSHPNDPDARKTVTAVMNWPNQQKTIYYWDGNASSVDMEFSQESGSETDKEHQSSMNENLDLTLGLDVNVKMVNIETKVQANFDSHQTWGGASIGETIDSDAKGLEIDKPAGEGGDKAYAFATAVYVAQDGTFKVAHATDPIGSTQGADWWRSQYGRKPDPALNLPYRFEWHKPYGEHLEEWWTLRGLDDPTRGRIRGFFLRSSLPDPVSGKNEYYAGAPTDGETVLLCARVYNYSFVDVPVFKAHFYYQLWNTETAQPIGDPISQPGMVVEVPKLDSALTTGGTTMREICAPWDTTGLSGTGNSSHTYRFLVRLDEENAIDELHESWDSQGKEIPGGNNEGFWPWQDGIRVFGSQSASLRGASNQDSDAASVSHAVISLPEDALAVKTAEGIETGSVRMTAGKTYPIRVHFVSDREGSDSRIFLFYDGDPDEGGTAIASRVVHGFAEGDNYRWGEWVPKALGLHEVWAHALEPAGTPPDPQSWASIQVEVVEPTNEPTATPTPTVTPPRPTATPASSDDGCSTVPGGSANSICWPLLPAIFLLWRRRRGR
jgi:hypothetical protein